MRKSVSALLKSRLALLLVAFVFSVPVALSGATSSAVPADEVIIARFFQSHTWKVFESSQVVGVVEGGKEVPVKREKRDKVFVSRVKAGDQELVLEVVTATESLMKHIGGARFHLKTRLRAGTSYEVKLLRNGERVDIWICEAGSDTAVSDRASFEINHPTIKLIIIPIG